jgi:aminoglycoside 3-N-acetyltransferase
LRIVTVVKPTEHSVVAATNRPVTRSQIVADLRALGIVSGDTVLVHSSLSKMGWVVGGAQAVIEALLEAVGAVGPVGAVEAVGAVGSSGTLMMPTHSSHWTEPADWQNPPLPHEWLADVYASIPAFDPALTPATHMGAVVNCFRHVPGVIRSNHPWASFAAVGKHAEFLTSDHRLDSGMGEFSPVARAYDVDAKVLLLGVGHGNNSSLHLCEHRSEWKGKVLQRQGAAIFVDGVRQWVVYEHVAADETDFETLGDDFDATNQTVVGNVGYAVSKLMDQRALVDFGAAWMGYHRPASLETSE